MKPFLSLFILFQLSSLYLNAQIKFPKGNKIDTVITVDVAYDETQLIFNTGKYKASDYLYQKITDSIHPQWLVTACFNGECRNDLELNGRFLDDYSLNDSTCFIAFHVESHDVEGSTRIIYRVYNINDPQDEAYLEYLITYKKPTAVKQINKTGFVTAYPNPAKNALIVSLPSKYNSEIVLFDVQGKKHIHQFCENNDKIILNTSVLRRGLYFLRVQNKEYIITEKIVLE